MLLMLLPFPPAAVIVLAVLLCHVRQVMSVLESFAQCGVLPAPSTVDHLVLQLVQGGLQHAPVQGMADLLDILAALQHTPGKSFVKMYAHVSSLDGDLLQGWVRGCALLHARHQTAAPMSSLLAGQLLDAEMRCRWR